MKLPRPMTARQILGIDVYTARVVWKVFGVRTIEQLTHLVKTQLRLRGKDHVCSMLLEGCLEVGIVENVMEKLACLFGEEEEGNEEEEARMAWEAIHRGSEKNSVESNSVANSSNTAGMEVPRELIRELREKEKHHQTLFHRSSIHGGGHGHHHHRNLTHGHHHHHNSQHNHSSPHHHHHGESIKFGDQSKDKQKNHAIMIASLSQSTSKKAEDHENILNIALFEDSDIDDEVSETVALG